MKRTRLTERNLTRVIKRVINEQNELTDDELEDEVEEVNVDNVADAIVDGYAKNGPIVTDRSQFKELYYMYRVMIWEAKDNGGKIPEDEYNRIVARGMKKYGITAPILPYDALKTLSQYI